MAAQQSQLKVAANRLTPRNEQELDSLLGEGISWRETRERFKKFYKAQDSLKRFREAQKRMEDRLKQFRDLPPKLTAQQILDPKEARKRRVIEEIVKRQFGEVIAKRHPHVFQMACREREASGPPIELLNTDKPRRLTRQESYARADEIRRRLKSRDKQCEIAAEFHVSEAYVSYIRKGLRCNKSS